MSTPRKTRDVLTRVSSGASYAAFRLLVDVSGEPLVLPVPANVGLNIQKVTLNFSWAVSNNPTTFRIWLFDADPTPPLTLADNVDPATVPFTPHVDKLTRVPDIQVFPTYGLSFGVGYYGSAPISLFSSTGTISSIFITTTGTTAPADGQIALGIYYDT